jgi:hypothetical protein
MYMGSEDELVESPIHPCILVHTVSHPLPRMIVSTVASGAIKTHLISFTREKTHADMSTLVIRAGEKTIQRKSLACRTQRVDVPYR